MECDSVPLLPDQGGDRMDAMAEGESRHHWAQMAHCAVREKGASGLPAERGRQRAFLLHEIDRHSTPAAYL